MAKTVGLPVGIAAEMIMNGKKGSERESERGREREGERRETGDGRRRERDGRVRKKRGISQ